MMFSKNSISRAWLGLFALFFSPLSINAQNCSVDIPQEQMEACKGEALVIEATSMPSSGTFLWLGLDKRTRKIAWPVQSDSQLVVQFTSPLGCVAYDTVFVKAIGFDSEITAIPAKDSIEQGEALTLTAKTNPIQGVYDYEWKQDGRLMVGENSRTLQTIANTNEDYISYKVTIEDDKGCIQEVLIGFDIIKSELQLPNAFTPDGDNVNDVFKLKVGTGTVRIEKLQIFNRWGAVVYEGIGDTAAWDGTKDGNLQPTGMYYYIARIKEGKGENLNFKKGQVHLLR